MRKKIILCGTPEFVINFFEEFLNSQAYEIVAVITKAPLIKKDRYIFSAVSTWAKKNHLKVFEENNLNQCESLHEVLKQSDFVLVFAFGKIISQKLLDLPKYGWLNIHPSLLPQFRGPSPIQYALLNNINDSGITIIKMNAKMDEGDIIAQKKIQFHINHNVNRIFEELYIENANWVFQNILKFFENPILKPQLSEPSYSYFIKNEDYYIQRGDDARRILNKIRAFGYVFLPFDKILLKCFEAREYKIGDLINIQGIFPLRVQAAGKKIMDIKSFLNGYRNK